MEQGAGGRQGRAKGYAGLRCILKTHQLQIPLPEFFVSPITANIIALWSKNHAEHRQSRGGVLHILIPSVKSAHLNVNCSCHLYWGKVDRRRRGFLSIMGKWQKRDEQKNTTHSNILAANNRFNLYLTLTYGCLTWQERDCLLCIYSCNCSSFSHRTVG